MNRRICRYLSVVLLVVVGGLLVGCQNNTYANSLKKEKKLIAQYIEREGLHIIKDEPEDGVWGEKDYLDMSVYGYDNMYFHLVKMGDTTQSAAVKGDKIILRYKRYTLDVNADTVSYWTTSDTGFPVEFTYLTDNVNACMGWHYAVEEMMYSDSEARIINPSKLGFEAEQLTVTPYVYDLKIKIKRY